MRFHRDHDAGQGRDDSDSGHDHHRGLQSGVPCLLASGRDPCASSRWLVAGIPEATAGPCPGEGGGEGSHRRAAGVASAPAPSGSVRGGIRAGMAPSIGGVMGSAIQASTVAPAVGVSL
ncbi:hypothetical protein [uncultured Massilia sp.]|uniref:hypothetical protein n=1 Tax=uncultured Massilia sp. TaxID=169973 RepID=UPI0025FB8380|nr:hypothetical protein [uncultured Massilia sp.]